MTVLFRAFLILYFTCQALSQSADHLFSDESLPPIPDGLRVGAYYYPWYADDFHRGDGYVRKLLSPIHTPTLGEYDDRSTEVIAQHLRWSRQANIGLWVCSWWGPYSREDNTTSQYILNHPDLGDHKIALLYETTGRIRKKEGYDPYLRVQNDMVHICSTYFDHPNYYTINGKPVILLYLTRVLSNVEISDDLTVLAETINLMRETAQNECNTDIYVIGDQVWGEAPAMDSDYDAFNHLDAITNYDLYGNTNFAPYAGIETVSAYYSKQADWLEVANSFGVSYIPATSPGYNDRGVRLSANHTALSRRLTADDEEGSLFVAQLLQARYLVDPGADNLLLVNSFNEWHEDTQLEPVNGTTTAEPELYTNGVEYVGYEELYLNILQLATCVSDCVVDPDTKTGDIGEAFEGPPPENVLVGAYYQSWHGDNFRNSLPFLRGELDTQGPELGLYTEADPFTIQEHVRYSKQANIGLWVASFYGRYKNADKYLRLNVIPEMQDIMLALLYEVQDRIDESNGYDMTKLELDVTHMCKKFFNREQYFTIQGRYVVFVKLTHFWFTEGVLETVIDTMRATALLSGYELYIIGDQAWGSAPSDKSYIPFTLLDAITNVDVYGNMGATGYAGQGGVTQYYLEQQAWRDQAWGTSCGFVPTSITGYNDRATGSESRALSRALDEGSMEGSLFAESLRYARYLVDSDLGNLLLVNSFNNWFDDTQIEPVVGTAQSEPESLTDGLTYYAYGDLYLDILLNATKDYVLPHDDESSSFPKFYPLQCNVVGGMFAVPCEEKWSEVIGESHSYTSEILIPCGSCILLDLSGPVLDLAGGIDIQGKLVIQEDYEIEIVTPYIRVQGELEIKSKGEVNGDNRVKISMVTGEDGIENFQAASSNADACGVNGCVPGPKSIFVAGGRMDIEGLPDDTPTWVNLIDVVTANEAPPLQRPVSCPPHGINLADDFGDASPSLFLPTLGASLSFTNSTLAVRDRTSTYHGAQLDLSQFIGCIIPNEVYLVSFEVRSVLVGSEDVLTNCARTGKKCLKVYADFMDQNLTDIRSVQKFEAPPSAYYYGSWMVVDEFVSFDGPSIDQTNVFLSLRFGGIEAKADIEIRNFKMRLAPETACEQGGCSDLVPCNGDAEYGIYPSPFRRRGDAQLAVQSEDGNQFWHISRQESTSNEDGMEWTIPLECMQLHAVYFFRMRVRVHDENPIVTAVYMSSTKADSENNIQRVVVCPESTNGEWVWCEGYYEIPEDALGDLLEVTVYFVTEGSSTASFDVDDVSFTFVRTDGPVKGLVVADDIQGKWGVGSNVLITSHSLGWSDHNTQTIISISEYEPGFVLLELDEDIPRPAAARSSDFPVEVALLSRNVAFVGGSGLTVYHTPGVKQTIVGAEFKNFGSENQTSRYPIQLHHLANSLGSNISKNSIIQSTNGCIILTKTSYAVVEENVAYDTAGHCYVLHDGTEENNTISRNLGAGTKTSVFTSDALHTRYNHILDSSPATFLLTNPRNTIQGNVGAGSEGEGFALVLNNSPSQQGDNPMFGSFVNNTAHSNSMHGFHVSMGSSYLSNITALALEGVAAYRNAGPGVLIYNSDNVVINNATFQDNRGNIDIDTAERVLVSNSRFVGYSHEMQLLESTEQSTWTLCEDRQVSLFGIRIPTFTRSRQTKGLQLENATFDAFSDVKVCKEYVLSVDPTPGWGPFDFFTSLSRVYTAEDASLLSLCSAYQNSMFDLYFTDKDSSLQPAGSSLDGVSSIVSDGSKALTFLPSEHCIYVADSCYYYCQDTCLRTAIISIDPTVQTVPNLLICPRGDSEFGCQEYFGSTYYEPILGRPHSSNSFVQEGLFYYVTLPDGRFTAKFFDPSSASRVWPTFASLTYSEPACSSGLEDGSVWIPPPSITDSSQCSTLLLNGDAENTTGWIAGSAGMHVSAGLGVDNSKGEATGALCEVDPTLSIYGRYSFGQYLDTRCLVEGISYEIRAMVRLYDSDLQGLAMSCPNGDTCPKMGIFFVSNDGHSWLHEIPSIDNIFSNSVSTSDAGADTGYQTLSGELVLDAEMASASSAFFYVARNNTQTNLFCMDSISVTLNG